MNKQNKKENTSGLDERTQYFIERCKQAGLKITPQRITIYNELIRSDEHPSAEMLYERIRKVFPNISLDTVNRTLITMSEIGLAEIVVSSGGAKRFDGGLDKHQHFKCIKCKRIIDFYHKPFDNIRLPREINSKFTVLKKTVYLEGICDLCKQKEN